VSVAGCLPAWYFSAYGDDHTIAGNVSLTSESGLVAVGYTDSGNDASNRNASGTKGTSGDTYSFTEGETGSDNFSLEKTITGVMDGSAQITTSFGSGTIGSSAESRWARIEKLSKGRLLGRFFAARAARLREVASHLGVHHPANLAGCPAR
jgi:hypothetical protein